MRKGLLITFAVLVLLCSLGAILYPPISDWYMQQRQAQVVTKTLQKLQAADTSVLDAARAAAEAYNRTLTTGTVSMDGVTSMPDADYDELLNVNGDGVMGCLEIPKLGVYLPIYHHTTGISLDKGIGHLHGTSLPVGGESTHAVISGHSGMMGQRMLTDLDQLAEGDVFYLYVLGDKLAYKVDQIKTVLPEDAEDLQIIPGEDHVTLVTCTPYGINTHRLLVRGVRTTEAAADAIAVEQQKAASTWNQQYLRGILVGLAIIAVILLPILVWRRMHRGVKH